MFAALGENLDICKYLVEKGAEVGAKNDASETALDISNNYTSRIPVAEYLSIVGIVTQTWPTVRLLIACESDIQIIEDLKLSICFMLIDLHTQYESHLNK